MMCKRVVTIALTVMALSGVVGAENPPPFQPQTVTVLGAVNAGTPIPFTQVMTQLAGELSMASADEDFVNLVPDWVLLAKALLRDPRPVVAYTTIAWADQVLRITCWLDRENSDLVRRRIRVVMEATEGTMGSVPLGTVIGISDGRLTLQAGTFGLSTHVAWTPGIFPDVLPTSWTLTTQVVPGLWKTGQPGRVSALYKFTSIQPPDGSPPIVYTFREGLPVQ